MFQIIKEKLQIGLLIFVCGIIALGVMAKDAECTRTGGEVIRSKDDPLTKKCVHKDEKSKEKNVQSNP